MIRMNNFWVQSLGLLLIAACAYLPHVQNLGYYNDDWYVMYDAITQGPNFFTNIFESDRPGRAPFMHLLYIFFGSGAIYYHLSAYIFRWLSGLSVLWIFRTLWPGQLNKAFTVAVLFLLFPGFLSQTNAIDFQSHIFALFCAFLSIALTLSAIQNPSPTQKFIRTVLSILTGWVYLSQMEYFIGIEGFRLAAVYILLVRPDVTETIWRQLIHTIRAWYIYGIIPVGFLIWRLFFFSSERRATDIAAQLGQSITSPLALLWWLVHWIQDVFNVLVTSWVWPVYQIGFQMRLIGIIAGTMFAFGSIIITFLIFKNTPLDNEDDSRTSLQIPLIGILTILIGQLPIILANRNIMFPDLSRYTLPGMIGACLMLAWVIYSIRNTTFRAAIIFLLVGMSTLTHYANGLNAANEWENIKDFWWQVSWRVPDIRDETTLIAYYPAASIQEDYFVWGPANLIYRREKQDIVPIQIKIPAAVLTDDAMFKIMQQRGGEVQLRRGNLVDRDYSKVLVLTQGNPGQCVRVLDGNINEFSKADSHRILMIGEFSNIDHVVLQSDVEKHLTDVFGPEPEHGWCYYYQKAALERQKENWQAVVEYGQLAMNAGFNPYDRVEWMPFLQAYAVLGMKEEFRTLIPILIEEPFLSIQACNNLQKIPDLNQEISELVNQTFCK